MNNCPSRRKPIFLAMLNDGVDFETATDTSGLGSHEALKVCSVIESLRKKSDKEWQQFSLFVGLSQAQLAFSITEFRTKLDRMHAACIHAKYRSFGAKPQSGVDQVNEIMEIIAWLIGSSHNERSCPEVVLTTQKFANKFGSDKNGMEDEKLVSFARTLNNMHFKRQRSLPADLLAEPFWQILLKSYETNIYGERVPREKLTEGLSLSDTLSERYISVLEDRGLLEPAVTDLGNGTLVYGLTDLALTKVSEILRGAIYPTAT